MEQTIYDVIIIGSGPGGMMTATYAGRANLNVLLLEKGAPGGKMLTTAEIENWPGIDMVTGMQLSQNMYQQAMAFGINYAMGDVKEVRVNGALREAVLTDGTVYAAKTIVVATGTREKSLPAPGVNENIGRGVSFCAICDGAFFRGKDVVVVGGGNSAIEESYHLAKLVNKVTLLVRKDYLRAEKLLQKKLAECDNVEILFHTELVEVKAENNKVSQIVTVNNQTNEQSVIDASGLFIYIGANPITPEFKDLTICDEQGYIITDENMQTSVPGIYAIGDVRQKFLRQIVTATGDGAIAAQHLQSYLDHSE